MPATSRAVLTAAGLLALTVATVALLARWVPLTNNAVLVVAVASPYLLLAAPTASALFALCRRLLPATIAAALTVVALAVQLPWYYIGDSADERLQVDLRVLTSNVRLGEADPESFVELARESADLIAVQELTLEEAERFSAAGISTVFPYSILKPAPGAGGIGLWSRFPLASVLPDDWSGVAVVGARLRIPGVRIDPYFASIHVSAPYPQPFANWRRGIDVAASALQQLADASDGGSVIVAGDFNSTPDMRQFRELLSHGYRDAAEQAGAGFTPTFPARAWCPPLLTIDHVLTRSATATALRSVPVAGSDHLGLIATIEVPVDPTAS